MAVRRAPLVIVAGPSGVGKTTVVEAVLATTALPLRRAVTATTRAPRPAERPGVDYHYWTPEEFARHIAAGEMLEYAVVHGRDYYGTPRAEVTGPRERGVGVLLVVDVQGADHLQALFPWECVTAFIAPPRFADLEARLRGRGSDSEERMQRRLATARDELRRAGEFDCLIVNGDLAHATAALECLLRDQFQLCEALAMLDDLKEEAIVNKVGGRFKLSVLIQKRMVALNTGAKPLVDARTPLDKMSIVLEEILQDKIYLDPTGEVATTNMTVSMNLPTPYYGAGSPPPPPDATPAVQATDDDD